MHLAMITMQIYEFLTMTSIPRLGTSKFDLHRKHEVACHLPQRRLDPPMGLLSDT